MTASSEARVPHDPQDLRSAVKHLRSMRCCNEPCACELVVRLEAWAHDMERLAPLEAAVLDALNVEDLRESAAADAHSGSARVRARGQRVQAAADALAALREAER